MDVHKQYQDIQYANILSSSIFIAILTIFSICIFYITHVVRNIEENQEETVQSLQIANENLNHSEKKYRALFDTTATPLVLIECDFTIREVNDEFLSLLGVKYTGPKDY